MKLLGLATIALFFLALRPFQKETALPIDQKISVMIAPLTSTPIAGTDISLRLASIAEKEIQFVQHQIRIHFSSSLGSTSLALSPSAISEGIHIPKHLSQASGWLSYALYRDQQLLDKGGFYIAPESIAISPIESYVGPPVVVAGGEDFSMMVAVPTDRWDNMIPNETEIVISEMFQGDLQTHNEVISNRIAWKRVFSPNLSGKINLAATMGSVATKQKTVEVKSQVAEAFSIEVSKIHVYADGNEMLTLKTSPITDRFGNLLTDGTSVQFKVTTSDQMIATSSGATINGIAQTKFLHPEAPSQWTIQGFVQGMAESEQFELEFKSVIDGFQVNLTEAPTQIIAEPLRNYMGQLVPDGVQGILKFDDVAYPETIVESENGRIIFEIDPSEFEAGVYTGQITVLGTTESFKLNIE